MYRSWSAELKKLNACLEMLYSERVDAEYIMEIKILFSESFLIFLAL